MDAILEAYITSDAGPNIVSLAEWVKLYPGYERELTEFTVTWGLLNWLPDAETSETIDHETLIMYGMSEVQRVLFQRIQNQGDAKQELPSEHSATRDRLPFNDAASSLSGLLVEGTRIGLTPRDMAVRLELSVALLRKLDRRLLTPTTIPALITERLARTLGRNPKQVAAYLQNPPTLGNAMQYRASRAPALAETQEDFRDAVRKDLSLTKIQKEKLLALV